MSNCCNTAKFRQKGGGRSSSSFKMPRKGRSKGLSSVTNSQKKYKASQKVREYGGRDAILTTKAADAAKVNIKTKGKAASPTAQAGRQPAPPAPLAGGRPAPPPPAPPAGGQPAPPAPQTGGQPSAPTGAQVRATYDATNKSGLASGNQQAAEVSFWFLRLY